ncbi:MAG: hypothetical protein WBE72_24450 [Terracidiphilus sp.]
MEPVNHWQPVTSEYQQELAPLNGQLRIGMRWRRALAGQAFERAENELPFGSSCILWFYLLAAGAYFVFGCILLSFPSSRMAAQLVGLSRIMVPFPLDGSAGVPFDNLLAETLFVMAMVSAAVGVLWLLRFRPVRWITLCYAGGSLLWCVYCLFSGKAASYVAVLTSGQRKLWLAAAAIDALIFCYVAFYPGVEKVFEQPE